MSTAPTAAGSEQPGDILVIADVHLGRRQSGATKVGPGLRWALAALEAGAAEGCGHAVVLGDVIDKKRYTESTYGEVTRLFERALELFDPVLFIAGNHDTVHDLSGTIPAGVTVAGAVPATYGVGGWAVHTASVEVDRDPRELAAEFPERVPGRPNLGLLHTSLAGEWTNPCLPADPDELRRCGYDAWVLAHVHRRLTVSEDPFIGYVGMGHALKVSAASGAVAVSPASAPVWERP